MEENTWGNRSDTAARAVTSGFGHRLGIIPGTYIGAISRPWEKHKQWHYWWQAHFVDCLVDTGQRELMRGSKFDGADKPSAGRLASRLVTTMRLRNIFKFHNDFYDDMAWLTLAIGRLDALAEASKNGHRRRNARAMALLGDRLTSAATEDVGGGVFWSTTRDFKNAPATSPVALIKARAGEEAESQVLVDWLYTRLFDEKLGLFLDGIKLINGEEVIERALWTYNQGPVLGALLELGGELNTQRANALIPSIHSHLTVETAGTRPLKMHGTGDGGLFTGILVRYLALAARSEALSAESTKLASAMVRDTAQTLWDSGQPRILEISRSGRKQETLIFGNEPGKTAEECFPEGTPIELATQLQAWMCFEAAATLG